MRLLTDAGTMMRQAGYNVGYDGDDDEEEELIQEFPCTGKPSRTSGINGLPHKIYIRIFE
ncbi:MAG: hypothetical protein ACE5JV_03990 [Nitrososphaerales archaeon]